MRPASSSFTHDLRAVQRTLTAQQVAIAGTAGVASLLTLQLEQLLATQQQLIDKIAELGTKQSHYQDRENAIIAALQAQVATQQAAIDAGTATDATAAQANVDALQAIIDAVPSDTPPTVTGSPTT